MSLWVRLGLTGLAILLGLIVASSTHGGFWHYFGFVFAILSALLLFRVIGSAFDRPGESSALLPVPRTQENRTLLGAVLAIGSLAALFVAAGAHGSGAAYYLGLIAGVLAIVYVFALIAASFDRR